MVNKQNKKVIRQFSVEFFFKYLAKIGTKSVTLIVCRDNGTHTSKMGQSRKKRDVRSRIYKYIKKRICTYTF